jgi:ParB family chromosome partitioning protein
LAAFRKEEISLACLMVLASVDDHARQEQAWTSLPSWNRQPDTLRRLLTQGEIESDRDLVARFVTLKAYEKAGGSLRRDLFSDDTTRAYLLDVALLERLALDKLRKTAQKLRAEGWKWVELRARYDYDEFVKHGQLRKTRRAPDAAEAATLADLESQLAMLQERIDALPQDDDSEAVAGQLEAQAEALDAQILGCKEALCVWPPELVAQAGCVVHVGAGGTAEVKRGLIRPEDRATLVEAARQASEDGDGAAGMVSLPAATTRPVHSEKLMRRLTAHRVAAVQAELLDRPDVALAALAAHLATRLLLDGWCEQEPLTVRADDVHEGLRREGEDLAESAAWQRLQAQREDWMQRLPSDVEAILPWLLQQGPDTVARLLTFLVATTVTGISGVEKDSYCNDGLARALDLDMRKWWRAQAGSYLSHVSKARLAEVVTEAAGAEAAAPLASMKKETAVLAAEHALSGTGWLPACLSNCPGVRDTARLAGRGRSAGGAHPSPSCPRVV